MPSNDTLSFIFLCATSLCFGVAVGLFFRKVEKRTGIPFAVLFVATTLLWLLVLRR